MNRSDLLRIVGRIWSDPVFSHVPVSMPAADAITNILIEVIGKSVQEGQRPLTPLEDTERRWNVWAETDHPAGVITTAEIVIVASVNATDKGKRDGAAEIAAYKKVVEAAKGFYSRKKSIAQNLKDLDIALVELDKTLTENENPPWNKAGA